MNPDIERAIAEIAADRVSGATAVVLRGIAVLRGAIETSEPLSDVAARLCAAQPAMAGLRTAAAIALHDRDPAAALDRLARRVERAPSSIARATAPLLTLRTSTGVLRIVTCSRSAAVEETILAAAAHTKVAVACSESRPAREGVALADRLASVGVAVDVYSDAAIGTALDDADALLVGADAISEDAFINKVGTRALCALADSLGISTLVLAAREKILPASVFAALALPDASSAKAGRNAAWRDRNPLFERVPLRWVAQLVTDAGPIPPSMVQLASLWPM
jgi:translation initiation factor 2B subunit (eIF-2B alpha/beta/delta family)